MTSVCRFVLLLSLRMNLVLYIAETESHSSPLQAIGTMLMLLPERQSGSHILYCYILLWAICPLAFPRMCVGETVTNADGQFPLESFFSQIGILPPQWGIFPMGIQQTFTGQQEEKQNGYFIILSISIPSSLSFSLDQVCFIPGLGNQTIRLQRGKDTGLMSLTSEDASSVTKEVQLLKHHPSIQLLCCQVSIQTHSLKEQSKEADAVDNIFINTSQGCWGGRRKNIVPKQSFTEENRKLVSKAHTNFHGKIVFKNIELLRQQILCVCTCGFVSKKSVCLFCHLNCKSTFLPIHKSSSHLT